MLQWLFFEQYSHEPNMAVARFLVRSRPTGAGRAQIAVRAPRATSALEAMERVAAGRAPTSSAERYTIADIALYAYTHVAHEGGFDLAGCPRSAPGWNASRAAGARHDHA